jgi:hypothetical protein
VGGALSPVRFYPPRLRVTAQFAHKPFLPCEGVPDPGDQRVHRIRVVGIHLVARRKLGGDLSRRHWSSRVAQHVQDGSAALAAWNRRRLLAPKDWPDRVRLCGRVEYADCAVQATADCQ